MKQFIKSIPAEKRETYIIYVCFSIAVVIAFVFPEHFKK